MEVYRQTDELYHHGVKGQRWGVRRFQNKDGTLTPAGQKHLDKYKKKEIAGLDRRINRLSKEKQKTMGYYDKDLERLHNKGVKRSKKLISKGKNPDDDKKISKIATNYARKEMTKMSVSNTYDYAINRINNSKNKVSNYTLDDVMNEKNAVFKKNLINGGRMVVMDYGDYVIERLGSYDWAKDKYRNQD